MSITHNPLYVDITRDLLGRLLSYKGVSAVGVILLLTQCVVVARHSSQSRGTVLGSAVVSATDTLSPSRPCLSRVLLYPPPCPGQPGEWRTLKSPL